MTHLSESWEDYHDHGEQDCPDCLGTGIGWGGPESSCPTCNGSGIVYGTVCHPDPDDLDDDQCRDDPEDDYIYDPFGDR